MACDRPLDKLDEHRAPFVPRELMPYRANLPPTQGGQARGAHGPSTGHSGLLASEMSQASAAGSRQAGACCAGG